MMLKDPKRPMISGTSLRMCPSALQDVSFTHETLTDDLTSLTLQEQLLLKLSSITTTSDMEKVFDEVVWSCPFTSQSARVRITL